MKRTASILVALTILGVLFPNSAHAVEGCDYRTDTPPAATNVVVWQLNCHGFVRVDAWTYYSDDSGQTLHTEQWQAEVFDGTTTTIYISDFGRPWDYRIDQLTNDVNGVHVWCEPTDKVDVLGAIVTTAPDLHDPASRSTLGVEQGSGAVRIEPRYRDDATCWYDRNNHNR